MKLNSISGLTYYVKDLDKAASFYETIGFRLGKRSDKTLTVYVNWFSVQLVAEEQEEKPEFQAEAHLDPKGAGLFINIKVDDVDSCYQELLDKGVKPSTEPRDWPWGNREFVLRDPDGYKLVFFQKLS